MKFKFVALIAAAVAAQFVAPEASANDQLAQSICAYVADNNKNNLRKTLSDNRMRLKAVYDGISCDGLPLVRFAIKNNAADTAEFIIKQLPSSQVAQSGDIEWANSNGFAASPILEVIKTRSAS
ncbi:DUF3718 domain-containing protein [Rheinheimera sp.]|uniref:DUF3718 domain-containing protein n=1 Tax=Rheinheimera sp. TaxID=1869214 RepID=UPI00307F092D